MSIHVRTWSGAGNARITDMTDAGQRGKTCRALRVLGTTRYTQDRLAPAEQRACEFTDWLMRELDRLALDRPFDDVRTWLVDAIAQEHANGVPESWLSCHDETIKAIHAPRPLLTAGVEGKWSAAADEHGIRMGQLDDPNEWCEITPHDQSKARAYAIAAKTWPQVQAASTLHAAATILRMAGAKLHGFCAVD